MRQNCTKNVWSAPFLALPFIADLNYDMRGARILPFLLRYTGERKVIAAMDATLQNIIEIALQQGIWAGLYIYLFFRMLKQNEEREAQYIGIYHMQGVQSEPFDHLKIIDEDMFMRCQQTVKGRSTKNYDGEPVVFRTDTRSLLTGVIYCGHCGCRLCYNHHHEERKLANGGTGIYDYETYRCYRKISSSRTCEGQSVYKATALNEAVENQVRLFLSKLEAVPKERLVELASARNEETYKVAYKQAQKDFENTQKQVTALEEEAVKALTGESRLDLSIVNQMLLKHRAKLEASQKAMEEAQARMKAEKENAKATKAQVDELLSWAECFDKADIGTKHLIVSRLIERVDLRTGYKLHIKFKISLKQFLGQE